VNASQLKRQGQRAALSAPRSTMLKTNPQGDRTERKTDDIQQGQLRKQTRKPKQLIASKLQQRRILRFFALFSAILRRIFSAFSLSDFRFSLYFHENTQKEP
jgi:hypothetical protein